MSMNTFLLAWVAFVVLMATLGRINLVLGFVCGVAAFFGIIIASAKKGV